MDETQANGSLPNGSASKKAAPSKEDIENAEKAKVEGNAAFKSSNWQEAVDRYSEAITLDPTNATFLTNRAAALMSQKKFKPALDDCQKASSLQHDSSAKTLIRLARCYFNLGNAEQAQTILNKIIQNAAPAKATGKKGGARAVNGSSSSVPTTTFTSEEVASAKGLEAQVKRLKDHLQQSERYRMNKQWTLANIALDKAIQEIGASGDSSLVPFSWRASKAYHYLGKGDLDAANSAATELLRLDSNNSEALVLRARVLFAKGELAKAIAHAQAALRSDPDLQAARSLMRKCKKLEGIKAEGNAAFKAGTFDQAIAKYDEALSVVTDEEGQDGHAPSFKATLYSNRATANSRLGNHEQTVKDCHTALELDKNYIKALRTRARAYLKLERYEEAVQDFKKALEESSISEESSSDTMNLKKELRSAEIDLKRSKQKDYYKILGVDKDASDIDIKKAYKRESLKHHPDKGGDEEKFKLVTEAFSVLSDPTKRRRFDMGADDADSDMPDAFGGGMGGFGGMGGMGGMGGAEINLADILAGMGGGGGHGFGGAPGGFGGMHGSSFAGAGGPYGGAGRRGGPSGFSFQ